MTEQEILKEHPGLEPHRSPFCGVFARERAFEYERDLLRPGTYGDELQFTIINRDARFQAMIVPVR